MIVLIPLTLTHAQQRYLLSRNVLQVGLGLIPGVGAQVGYISRGDFFTTEGTFYVSLIPGFLGGESTLTSSGGAGVSIRALNILNIVELTDLPEYNLDVGLRVGVSYFYAFHAGGAYTANPFGLFTDLFVRGSRTLASGRVIFAELGFHEPLLRGGIWLSL